MGELEQAGVAGTEPNGSVVGLSHGDDEEVRHGRGVDSAEAFEAAIVKSADAVAKTGEEQVAVGSASDGADNGLGAFQIWFVEPPVAVAQQSGALESDPQSALRVGSQGENGPKGSVGGIGVLEKAEVQTVETNETLLGTDPKIAIVGLCKSINWAAGKAILTAYHFVHVLGNRGTRINPKPTLVDEGEVSGKPLAETLAGTQRTARQASAQRRSQQRGFCGSRKILKFINYNLGFIANRIRRAAEYIKSQMNGLVTGGRNARGKNMLAMSRPGFLLLES